MTDAQKLLFFRLLGESKLNVERYYSEEIYDQQRWEIQEIGEIPWGNGDIGVCANWWGETFLDAVENFRLFILTVPEFS